MDSFKLSTKEKDDKVRVLGVGPNGAGKTVGFASWPGKTLIFDFDKRYAPLIDWLPDRLDDITIQPVSANRYWEDFHAKINDLADYNQYDNIIIDSITSLSIATVVMQMMVRGDLRVTSAEMAKNKGGDKLGVKFTKGGVSIPGWDEINGEAMLITQMLEVLKSFNCNLFVNAHPIRREKEGSEYTSLVTFGPKVESMIPGYFDEIWYFDKRPSAQGDDITRRVYPRPSMSYPNAKTAIKGMPPYVDFANLRLYDVMKPYL